MIRSYFNQAYRGYAYHKHSPNCWAFLLQIKYKQSAEMEKDKFTSVVDTPEIIHAQQVKNLSSQVRFP